jgi:hypothetical protein
MFSAKKVILVFLIVSCFLIVSASAQTVSFADPATVNHKDVYLYSANGTLLGLYNTTSTGISLDSSAGADVIFTFKPQYSNPLDDPSSFLDGAIGWLQTNVLSLLILGAMGGLLLKRF